MRKKLLAVVAVLFLAACSENYSKGYRVGVVRKFSNKGVFIKSYEGELLLGGVVSTGGDSPTLVNEIWKFSVDPEAQHGEEIDAVVRHLDRAAETGERVKVFYNEDTTIKFRTDSRYHVFKVEFLGK